MQTCHLREKWLSTAVLIFLWGALIEDVAIFLLSWLYPNWWFELFHHSQAMGLDSAWLRRSAGQWLAFSLLQGLALWRWRREPVWLVIVAAARFTDLFTDISYVLAAINLTNSGRFILLPLPLLNLIGVVIMVRAYRQARFVADC